ncbi:MAG: formimidoylglutamate deiminase, partial [Thermomicrobiaceae bacterium]|nr:formimidoylglutamate deiminase [Thermomicrobiaceae bacterium]
MTARDASRRYRAAHLHRPSGWLSPGYVEVDASGTITLVSGERPLGWHDDELERLDGFVVPGMVNLHSHAHQRGLAGHAERVGRASDTDTFWSWRDRMYAFVGRLDPDAFEAIAAEAYREMLVAGYTSVGEFHYLHHDPAGRRYANPAEMSERVIAAAERAGIALTLLPALYLQGGIGKPPAPGQRRFVHGSVEGFLRLVEHLRGLREGRPLLRVGVAPHSLRAVGPDALAALVAALPSLAPGAPIHLHLAEQRGEVEEVLAGLGATPGRWLLDHAPVDRRWTLIHCTHCTTEELAEIAARGAGVGLCPTTEANLGDGLFPLVEYHAAGGRWGIGSDGNAVLDPAEELRLLEYGQRLSRERRSILVAPGCQTRAHAGRLHYDLALVGGAQALAQP